MYVLRGHLPDFHTIDPLNGRSNLLDVLRVLEIAHPLLVPSGLAILELPLLIQLLGGQAVSLLLLLSLLALLQPLLMSLGCPQRFCCCV